MDPVHGGIPYFSHEKQLLDHPLFQRLRHIKQNDILHFVFPGATHSRFEHCIGTMYVAGRIFKNMIRNYLTNRKQLFLSKEQVDAIQYCYGCLRMAALLHDLGHMPFSHLFEESKSGELLLSDSEIIKTLWTDEIRIFVKDVPTHLRHEHYSILAASELLKGLVEKGNFQFEVNDIIGMMEDGNPVPSERFCVSAVATLKLFSKEPDEIDKIPNATLSIAIRDMFKDIISGEIDADKMDYLLRDSYFSGCNYGTYNIDHLTQNICVGFDKDPANLWIGIAINKKGLGALEDFVHSRFRMYLQVYGHKTVVGLKWLLREAVAEIISDADCQICIKTSLSDMRAFADFTDTYCWEAFRLFAQKHPDSACADIVARRKLRHIAVIDDQLPFEKRNKQTSLEELLGKRVVQNECASRFSKINPLFQKMRLLVKDEITGKYQLESITKSSSFFSKFQDVTVTHYYEAPHWMAQGKTENISVQAASEAG
jgi:HD superfamily phosphohydrolase